MHRSSVDYHLDLAPSASTLTAAAVLRHQVFVVEQGVAATIERDGRDGEALHVAVHAQSGDIVGTGRLMVGAGFVKVQRVAVASERRGEGLGRLVMRGLESIAIARGAGEVRLSSQEDAVPFYERLGYVGQGAPFLEAGIVHLAMTKAVEARR